MRLEKLHLDCASSAPGLPTTEAHNSGLYSIGKIICRDFSEPARADSDRDRCRHAGRNNHDRDGRSTKPKAMLGDSGLKAEAKSCSGGMQGSERRSPNIVAEGRQNRAGAGGCCSCCVGRAGAPAAAAAAASAAPAAPAAVPAVCITALPPPTSGFLVCMNS